MEWKIDKPGQFYDCGEPGVVYFDPSTGDTHLLSAFAAFLIQKIADNPGGTDAIIESISPELDPTDLAASTDALPGLLDELVSLEILERV